MRHKVRDFKTWKTVYDADQQTRADAGLTEKYLLRSEDDPNEIVLLYEVHDVARARAFGESADLGEKMREGGVVDKPDVYILNG